MSEATRSKGLAATVGFVYDGYENARIAVEPEIRRQVLGELAAEWNAASLWRRLWLRWKIEAEINRRVHKSAPTDACY